MANAGVKIDGLEELREALKKLPDDLLQEASAVVHAHAEATRAIVTAAYPIKTGNLRRGMGIELGRNTFGVWAQVRNRAKHAWIYENGTGPRTKNGKSTGTMPASHIFVSTAMSRRRLMVAALVDIVRRAGLTVTGFN